MSTFFEQYMSGDATDSDDDGTPQPTTHEQRSVHFSADVEGQFSPNGKTSPPQPEYGINTNSTSTSASTSSSSSIPSTKSPEPHPSTNSSSPAQHFSKREVNGSETPRTPRAESNSSSLSSPSASASASASASSTTSSSASSSSTTPSSSPSPPPSYPTVSDLDAARGDAYKTSGNTAFSSGDYANAILAYTRSISFNPYVDSYYANRAAAYLMLNQPLDALFDSERCLHLNFSNRKAFQRLIKCLLAFGLFESAKERIRQQQKLLVDSNLFFDEWKECEKQEIIFQNIKNKKKTEDLRGALVIAQNLQKDLPACISVRILLIDLFILLRQFENAQTFLSASSTLLRSQTSAVTAAISATNSTLTSFISTSIFPSNSRFDLDLLRLKATLQYYNEGNLDNSLKCLSEALRLDPDHTDCVKLYKKIKKIDNLKSRGNDFYTKNNIPEAITSYTQALEIDEKNHHINSVLYLNRAAAEMKRKRYETAALDCSRSISLKNSVPKAYLRRANCRLEMKAFDEAISDYETALKLVTENGESSDAKKEEIVRLLKSAKLELKKSKRRDHYAELGLKSDANQDQIKKAYRKMALQWHPDKNSETEAKRKEAENKFKDITHAYEVLSDAQAKRRYDLGLDLQEDDDMGGGQGHGPGGIPMNHLFRMFMQQQGGGGGGARAFRGGGNPFGGGYGDD